MPPADTLANLGMGCTDSAGSRLHTARDVYASLSRESNIRCISPSVWRRCHRGELARGDRRERRGSAAVERPRAAGPPADTEARQATSGAADPGASARQQPVLVKVGRPAGSGAPTVGSRPVVPSRRVSRARDAACPAVGPGEVRAAAATRAADHEGLVVLRRAGVIGVEVDARHVVVDRLHSQ
jgi:hypothetical protein